MRPTAMLFVVTLAGCNAIWGVDDLAVGDDGDTESTTSNSATSGGGNTTSTTAGVGGNATSSTSGSTNGTGCSTTTATVNSSASTSGVGGSGGTCGNVAGALQYGGHCYVGVSTKMSWSAAQAHCVALGSGWDLATIGTPDEFMWTINNVSPNPPHHVWIGANDQADEGNFNWVNGESWSYQPWWPSQPDNGDGGADEDCVEFVVLSNLQVAWNDTVCTLSSEFICEK